MDICTVSSVVDLITVTCNKILVLCNGGEFD